MRKLKSFGRTIGFMLCILAVVFVYQGYQSLSSLRPVSDYEDAGVHTFEPYRVLPIQEKNTSSSNQYRRRNPTRTVYKVYYKSTDISGYEWTDEAITKSAGEKIVEKKEPVERRVLSIKDEGKYITVEPNLTAETYVAGLSQKYTIMTWISVAYLAIYFMVWLVIWRKRQEQKEIAR